MPGETRSPQEGYDAGRQHGAYDERFAIVELLRDYLRELSAKGCDAAAIAMRTAINRIEARGAQPPSEAKEE